MELIYKGKNPETVKIKTLCMNCNSIYEITVAESRMKLTCQVCNLNLSFSEENSKEAEKRWREKKQESNCDMREVCGGNPSY